MNKVNDTNVLIRTNHNLLSYEKMEAGRILAMGGAGTAEGLVELRKLNREFIRLNISPGGCADLLAVTILLWNLERLSLRSLFFFYQLFSVLSPPESRIYPSITVS